MTRNELSKILDNLYLEAQRAEKEKEIPVSAALLWNKNVFYAHNQVEKEENPFSHAEINVIREGLKESDTRYLKDGILIVTLEPCLTCLGAILKVGIKDLYYVLDDPKEGALSHYHAFVDDRLRVHRIQDERFKELMDTFFASLRQ